MNIGVVKEIKPDERRVALLPGGVADLVHRGHAVVVQVGAGAGAGAPDTAYVESGATIVESGEAVFNESELIVHVKEPQTSEIAMLRPDHILFTYLHLAAYPKVAEGLLASGATCIAYETVVKDGTLPLLAPMSHIAGRLSTQVGAFYLMAPNGGMGTLLGGHAGVPQGQVVVIGAGAAGLNATDVAVGLGAQVTVLDVNLAALERVHERWGSRVVTDYSTRGSLHEWTARADLVVGAVLVAGDRAPVVVDRGMLSDMRQGAVMVDISIDQGGCFETSRETTHQEPTYVVDGIVHYAVGNIPGSVPHTSSRALSNATLPYVHALSGGIGSAIEQRPELTGGINVAAGKMTNAAVAHGLNTAAVEPQEALGIS
ncbi:MAG: alanine dehydrogenase [Acidimicrobiia bacterium]|nr:MAG: alanine dehydrogenase [Acidimicrobiia bacterium]